MPPPLYDFHFDQQHATSYGVQKGSVAEGYYWAIMTRFKRFNMRILAEFQEAQDYQ